LRVAKVAVRALLLLYQLRVVRVVVRVAV